MNYQHYLDELATLSPDVQNYIKRAVDQYNDSSMSRTSGKYLALLTKDSNDLDSINYLNLLTDEEWDIVSRHTEEELL